MGRVIRALNAVCGLVDDEAVGWSGGSGLGAWPLRLGRCLASFVLGFHYGFCAQMVLLLLTHRIAYCLDREHGGWGLRVNMKKCEYDQEIPQSQTADNPMAPRGKATQPTRDTRKTD